MLEPDIVGARVARKSVTFETANVSAEISSPYLVEVTSPRPGVSAKAGKPFSVSQLGVIPSFDWPVVPFPQLRYPLENFVKENAAEEERCLNAVKEVFKTWKAPIAACIVEPIQAEGGDRYASADFFRQLQMIIAENDAQFIVDEVQTGVCATGTYWAHEQWDLPHSPDYVIFSKKMQAAGFFYRDESRPDMPYRIYNTWLGDPSRIVLAGVINSWIANNDVQARVNHVGKTLIDGLHSLHELFPDIVTNVRGQGTFCAFDLPDRDTQQQFLAITRKLGLFVGACGESTIRFRPMLVFGDKHCNIAIDILGSACASLKMNN
jgi:4-aminobutyrate aminotransferase / (S)-3-amino-2-methylpropionate transaminase